MIFFTINFRVMRLHTFNIHVSKISILHNSSIFEKTSQRIKVFFSFFSQSLNWFIIIKIAYFFHQGWEI
ncbi:hypothetical protein DPD17_26680 [Salmonella enterica subsp. enterica serovar Ago]|nr:hypothetical protein [Salmonella enterica subsp. enterica serovar Ago]ECC3370943.1 hypothetical protein [Salmonella enterica subsp. enterica serovar Ago]